MTHPRLLLLLHAKTEQEEDTVERKREPFPPGKGRRRDMGTERETDRGTAIEISHLAEKMTEDGRVIKGRSETETDLVTPCLLLSIHLMPTEGKKSEIMSWRRNKKNSERRTEDGRRR